MIEKYFEQFCELSGKHLSDGVSLEDADRKAMMAIEIIIIKETGKPAIIKQLKEMVKGI